MADWRAINQKLKEDYPLRETLERLIGDRLQRSRSRYDEYLCPFHDDTNASFLVYDGYCVCQAGCTINGKAVGDLFSFLMEYLGTRSMKQVGEFLTGRVAEPPKRVVRRDNPERVLTMRDVKEAMANLPKALPYYEGRGIPSHAAQMYYLGMKIHYPSVRKLKDGRDFKFYCDRYAIPNVAHGRCRKIELRTDMQHAVQQLAEIDPRILDMERAHFKEKKGREPEELDMAEWFAHRYVQMLGGIRRPLIGNLERIMWQIEYQGQTGYFFPKLPYVLWHEGAIKAYATENAPGDLDYFYPSIYGHPPENLEGALVGVERLIIVADNDPDKERNGRIINAGKSYAEAALAASRRTNAQIIYPPPDFKDADEVVKAGQAHAWLSRHGIEPIKAVRPPSEIVF